MRVLVACESSGTVRDAFRARGHDAWSCDISEPDSPSDFHITGDAVPLLGLDWDLVIAHPPCTYLCNSGVRHLHSDPSRWAKMVHGAALFRAFVDAPTPRLCIENPIMHGHAKALIGCGKQDQTVQPWMFGHPETKATCLWLKGLPLLAPTDNVKAEMMRLPASARSRIHHMAPSKDRGKLRSITYPGIASAMASQWGGSAPVQPSLFQQAHLLTP